jgi:hypothetical protein
MKMAKKDGYIVFDEAHLKEVKPKQVGESDFLALTFHVPLGPHVKHVEELTEIFREGPGGAVIKVAAKQSVIPEA